MPSREPAAKIAKCSPELSSFVFVSYSHQDTKAILPIIEAINARGYNIWYDRGINISSTWTDEIAVAIMNCQVLVVFLSRDSASSNYVRTEVEFALNNHKRIIPVYLDGLEVLPPGLALGLNATQGITDVSAPGRVVEQICQALSFNSVPKEGQVREAKIKLRRLRRNGRRLPLAAALLALVALIGFLCVRSTVKVPIPDMPAAFERSQAIASKPGFSLPKKDFRPAEPIWPIVGGLSEEALNRGLLMGLAQIGAEHGTFVSSIFVEDSQPRLRAPLEPGHYELRLYASADIADSSTLAQADKIAVSGRAQGAFKVEFGPKSVYAPYESIPVKVREVPRHMIDDGAMAGLFRKGAPPDNFIVYINVRQRDQDMSLEAPYEPGDYEVRLLATNAVMAEATLVDSFPFKVE
jgi:hypothetical protein